MERRNGNWGTNSTKSPEHGTPTDKGNGYSCTNGDENFHSSSSSSSSSPRSASQSSSSSADTKYSAPIAAATSRPTIS
ncbi:MAG TPA: hypothetical protein D7H77_01900 [Candidatus Poseidoniales archaeon]|nr:MAG TPA: hypothetical protein D7H77_01900 [Candidatus Poseidoniales archaeon]